MASGDVKTYPALLPLSWLYSLVTRGRNLLFDWGVLEERQFDVPVITVGNLTVGGTGKTPHVEHLVRLLRGETRVAVLSRGYRRQTKGFVLADAGSTAATIGDEPLQMHRKFGDITVAVDADRRQGIALLLQQEPSLTRDEIYGILQDTSVKLAASLATSRWPWMPTAVTASNSCCSRSPSPV